MKIRLDNLQHPQVIGLIRAHLASMAPTAPAESRHALDIDGLRSPDITFWSAWDGPKLAGIGALKQLSPEHAEIKSMKTATDYLRRGIASKMLSHLILEATHRGYKRLSLETGSMAFFEPARKLYSLFGFMPCAPFADYVEDPNSVFMSKQLSGDKNAASENSMIAELEGRLIGFVQIIDPALEETHYWGDVPSGLRAVDIWIGEQRRFGEDECFVYRLESHRYCDAS